MNSLCSVSESIGDRSRVSGRNLGFPISRKKCPISRFTIHIFQKGDFQKNRITGWNHNGLNVANKFHGLNVANRFHGLDVDLMNLTSQ